MFLLLVLVAGLYSKYLAEANARAFLLLVLYLVCGNLFASHTPVTEEDVRAALAHIPPDTEKYRHFSPPSLRHSQLRDLVRGDLVLLKQPVEGELTWRYGLRLFDLSPEVVLVALRDNQHDPKAQEVFEHEFDNAENDVELIYQRSEGRLFFPDREWVICVEHPNDLYTDTNGRVIGRYWDLLGSARCRGATVSGSKRASVEDPNIDGLELNEGGWTLASVRGGGTLVIYQIRLDAGHVDSDSAGADLVFNQQIEALFEGVLDFAETIPGHYRSAHQPILLPNGEAVSCWPRETDSAASVCPGEST